MVLVAIIDSLASTELDELVRVLRRDGFVCLSSSLPLEELHDTIGSRSQKPIVIYGDRSMDVPYDDCARIWLSCGPTIDDDVDISHALVLHRWDRATPLAAFTARCGVDSNNVNVTALHDGDDDDAAFRGGLARRTRALSREFQFMTFPKALSFMAEAIAFQRVQSMGLNDGESRLLLRHVTK
jgi:hypothetical protein